RRRANAAQSRYRQDLAYGRRWCYLGARPDGRDRIGGRPRDNRRWWYHAPLIPPPPPAYQNAVYYCSQDIATALCSRSDDGGSTYGPSVPIYNLTACGGLHGHV